MDWDRHIPYMMCILILLIIFGIRYTIPQVTKAVQSVQQVTVPGITVTQYPLVGCALSRVHSGIWWE